MGSKCSVLLPLLLAKSGRIIGWVVSARKRIIAGLHVMEITEILRGDCGRFERGRQSSIREGMSV